MVKVASSFDTNGNNFTRYTNRQANFDASRNFSMPTAREDLIFYDDVPQDNTETPSPEFKFELTPEGRKMLTDLGFYNSEIDAILDGEMTFQDAINNIYSSETRRRGMYEYSYFECLKDKFPELDGIESITELKSRIEEIDRKLSFDINEEIALANMIYNMIAYNYDINTALNSPVLYSYVDDTGKTIFEYDDTGYVIYDSRDYKMYSYRDLFGEDTPLLKELYGYLMEYPSGEKVFDYYADGAPEFYQDLLYKKDNFITELEAERETLQNVLTAIEEEVDYQINYIDRYVMQPDFEENCGPNLDYETLSTLLENTGPIIIMTPQERQFFDNPGLSYHIIAALLGKCFNNKDYYDEYFFEPYKQYHGVNFMNKKGGTFYIHDVTYSSFLYQWRDIITDDEIKVYNYIYNTTKEKGHRAALQYLEDISMHIDSRYIQRKYQSDSEWATTNGFTRFGGSCLNILLGWLYGLNAVGESIGSYIYDDELYLTRTYSPVDTYKQAIAEYYSETSGPLLGTLYKSGLTIADTIIATTLLRGIVGNGVIYKQLLEGSVEPFAMSFLISGTFLGSKQYVAALNEALLMGCDKDEAITKAIRAGALEMTWKAFAMGTGSLHVFDNVKAYISKSNELRSILQETMKTASIKLSVTVSKTTTIKIINLVAIIVGESQFGKDDMFIQRVIECLVADVNNGTLIDLPTYIQEQMNTGLTEDQAIEKAMEEYEEQFIKVAEAAVVYNGLFPDGDFDFDKYIASYMIAQNI